MLLPLLLLLFAAAGTADEDAEHVNNLKRLETAFRHGLDSTLQQIPILGSLSNAGATEQLAANSSSEDDAFPDGNATNSESESKGSDGGLLYSALSVAELAGRRALDMFGIADDADENDSNNLTATYDPAGESTENLTRVHTPEGDSGVNGTLKASANLSVAYESGCGGREEEAAVEAGSSDYLGLAIVGMSLGGIAILLLTVWRNRARQRSREEYARAATADPDDRPADISKRYSDISLQLMSELNGAKVLVGPKADAAAGAGAGTGPSWDIEANVAEMEDVRDGQAGEKEDAFAYADADAVEEEFDERPRPDEPCSTL